MDTNTAKKAKKKIRQRTIAKELLVQWQNLTRNNDAKLIAKELEVSKPTIDNALIYGYVQQQRIIDGINTYFETRLTKERADAGRLQELGESSTPQA